MRMKREGLTRGAGVSVNRWEPANVIETLRTGLFDAVQVIFNIFDRSPVYELFPVCRELNVAVIARVPFDDGTLTGNLTTKRSRWPQGDWRNSAASTVIPGLRKIKHVDANAGVSDGRSIDASLLVQLKAHRWDGTPMDWSQ